MYTVSFREPKMETSVYTMGRTAFVAQHEDLVEGHPEFGTVAALPWDTDIFGFPVGEYRLGACAVVDRPVAGRIRRAFAAWTAQTGTQLCAASVPTDRAQSALVLYELGFTCVDFNVRVTLPGLDRAKLPQPRSAVRLCEPQDRATVQEIAEHSFRFGRYHADPCFPAALADLRYRRWMENALASDDPAILVYVLGESGAVRGFFHVVVSGHTANLRLAAVEGSLQRTLAGFDLYAATLADLKQRGVREAVSRISASNTGVINVYAMLGFRFGYPEYVLHWHAPGNLCP